MLPVFFHLFFFGITVVFPIPRNHQLWISWSSRSRSYNLFPGGWFLARILIKALFVKLFTTLAVAKQYGFGEPNTCRMRATLGLFVYIHSIYSTIPLESSRYFYWIMNVSCVCVPKKQVEIYIYVYMKSKFRTNSSVNACLVKRYVFVHHLLIIDKLPLIRYILLFSVASLYMHELFFLTVGLSTKNHNNFKKLFKGVNG